jgi:hypothetical protein
MRITSAFDNNTMIPRVFTCEGEDRSPPFWFHDLPKGTARSSSSSRTRTRPTLRPRA